MEFYRKTRSHNMGVNPGNSVDAYSGNTGGAQGLATLVTMIAVLVIILLFCFWSAPGIRDFCRRNICCICPINDPEPRELSSSLDTHHHQSTSRPQHHHHHGAPLHNETNNNNNTNTMPTIVLLPFGRMLVVDRSLFAQMEADDTGLDFLELSANVIRAHHDYLMRHDPDYMRHHWTSSSSKSDLTLSQLSVEQHRPPAYEDIFGLKTSESLQLPPTYSEANLLLRQLVMTGSLNVLHRQRSFSTRTVNDSILIRYESERGNSNNNNRRFLVRQQPLRSASLDDEIRSAGVVRKPIDVVSSSVSNLSDVRGSEEGASVQDHVVLFVGENCATATTK